MAVGRINGVAALTGFYHKKMYGHFAGTKNSGRNNEVAVRRGSTVPSIFIDRFLFGLIQYWCYYINSVALKSDQYLIYSYP